MNGAGFERQLVDMIQRIINDSVNTMQIAKVEVYNAKTQEVDVFIPYIKTKISNVRLCQFGGSLGVGSYPLAKGDHVLVLFFKSGLQNYIANQSITEQDEELNGFDNLSNCVAIPLSVSINSFNRVGFKNNKGEVSIDPQTGTLKIVGANINVINKAVEISNKNIEIFNQLTATLDAFISSPTVAVLLPDVIGALTPIKALIATNIAEVTTLTTALASSSS